MTKQSCDRLNQAKARLSCIFPVGNKPWKRRAAAALFGMALIMGAADATHANEIKAPAMAGADYMTPEDANKYTPFVDLGVMDSQANEDLDQFVMRLSHYIDAFTRITQHEACGVIQERTDGQGWRVRVITNRSQIACARVHFEEPGYRATDETIHSHPANKSYLHANARDTALRGFRCGSTIFIHPHVFSDGDYANSGGYLVVEGKVLHQSGEGTERTIGMIDENAPVPGLRRVPWTRASVQPGEHQAQTSLASLAWSRKDAPGLPSVSCGSRFKK